MKLKNTLILLVPCILLMAAGTAQGQDYASSSVLRQGRWVKLAVTQSGIYRIDYTQIVAAGITDPARVALFGNNSGQLSFYNDGTAPDDMEEIAFFTEKGNDGIFNSGDYILFYAEGTHRRVFNRLSGRYDFIRHHYSDTAYYFLTSLPGSATAVTTIPSPTESPSYTSAVTDFNYRHEVERNNIIKSGREWYQQVVPGMSIQITPFGHNISTAQRLHYTIRVLARSDTWSEFQFRQEGTLIKSVPVTPVNMTDINGVYANIVSVEDSCFAASSSPGFSIMFSANGNLAATGYIDYVDLAGRANLTYNDRQLFISDSKSVGEDRVTQFRVASGVPLTIWDVTDPERPGIVVSSYTGGNTIFNASTDSLRTFLAFTPAHILTPVIINAGLPNQDLHALQPVEMLIVSHPLFTDYAERLSETHLSADGLTSIVVTPQQIYNEFSGGIPDAVAIRNFVRMMREKGKTSATPLRYLLLFGDGSYDNKTRPPENTAFIPTWQSVNSHIGVLSFTSDDFYGLLDDGEGEADGFLDIGIGRLPVTDTTQAGAVTRKITGYISEPHYGSWRNNLCIVADDEDGNMHMTDAENLSGTVAAYAAPMNIDKIYLDAYRQVTSVSGNSYPDAVKAVNDRIAAGCLIFNYVGHGSETGLAHERVIRTDNINSWNNKPMLPLFITATCEFSRFDDVDINPVTGAVSSRTSAGEMVLLNPSGGGIALMSTTRVVYSAPNFTLNNNIYKYAFTATPDGLAMRLGDIIRLAKVNSGTGMNKRNFLLLGDPAMRLAWPRAGKVVTDSINGVSVMMTADTLKALSVITVSGHIEDNTGALMSGFNGTVEPVVFDKPSTLSTLANDGGSAMTFPVAGNILFSGKTTVSSGLFRFTFVVPMDINYSFGNGRISYYASNENSDINGNFEDIVVGGFSDFTPGDVTGPEIRLFMNDTLFIDGGTTDTSPVLLALVSDESGINATGAGIGHDIIMWIDDDKTNAVTLNHLFRTDLGGHKSGSLSYPLMITDKGEHTITLRAWDNFNNPSVSSLRFIVETSGIFRLTELLSYPNPSQADIWFSAGHNRPDSEIDVTVTIYSTSGQKVRVIRESVSPGGYRLPDIQWDGCDGTGGRLSGGIYIWRIEAVSEAGERAAASGKIIIL